MERSNGPNIKVEEICNKDCYSGIQSIEVTQSYRKNLERFSLRRLVVLYVSHPKGIWATSLCCLCTYCILELIL